jgi:hypothetical protein
VTGTDVWLQAVGPFLLQLDPGSGDVIWNVTSDRGTGALLVNEEALWMSIWRADSVLRIDL